MHADIAIDDAHELVNVSFKVEMGKRAKIASVRIDGPDQPENAKLFHAMQSLRARLSGALVKPGKPYTPSRITAATTQMKRHFVETTPPPSTIKKNPPQYDTATNRVAVSFKVEVGPVVDIRTEGAKLTVIPFLAGRQRKKLIPIYSEGTVDRDLVEEGQRNRAHYFQKKGFNNVKLRPSFRGSPTRF